MKDTGRKEVWKGEKGSEDKLDVETLIAVDVLEMQTQKVFIRSTQIKNEIGAFIVRRFETGSLPQVQGFGGSGK